MAERTQMLRYARDLAELYRSAKQDRRALDEVRGRFHALERACFDLVRCLSPEAAAKRVARAAVDLLGLQTAGVYLSRGERFVLASRDDDESPFPAWARVAREDLEALAGEPDEFLCPPWSLLTGGEATVVIPLLGRRRAVGFVAGRGQLEDLDDGNTRETISLLMANAGVVLENYLLEEKRGALALPGAPLDRDRTGMFQGMLGRCQEMREIFALIDRLAQVDSPVLILGETGTGKSMVARALHECGRRGKNPFVPLNCGAIPEALVESELFGHEAGAFTGAVRQHRGKVEQADGGTLFLDEIGELPLSSQVKLLTFLEEGRFSRVGGEEQLSADVRVVSATNRDIDAAVKAGSFRQDLRFRLNVFTVELPPLRKRGADVLGLARVIAENVARRYRLPVPAFDEAVKERLLAYPWTGNVRELRNVIEKAVILSDQGPLSVDVLPSPSPTLQLPDETAPDQAAGPNMPAPVFDEQLTFSESKGQMIERWEVAYIEDLLSRTRGNIAWAARMARLDKKNLHRKLKRYGIDARAHKRPA